MEYQMPQSQVHAVLLIDQGGNAIFNHFFTDYLKTSSGLLSGLLTAFNSFVGSLVEGKGIIESVKHQDMVLHIEKVDTFLVVSVGSDDSFIIKEKTRILAMKLERILKSYQSSLSKASIPQEFKERIELLIEQVF